MAKVRKDKRGRNLHKGEYQRPDGRYAYAYRYNGKRVFIYDTDLASLRKKEQQMSRPGCSVVKWTGGFVGRSRTRMSGGRGE